MLRCSSGHCTPRLWQWQGLWQDIGLTQSSLNYIFSVVLMSYIQGILSFQTQMPNLVEGLSSRPLNNRCKMPSNASRQKTCRHMSGCVSRKRSLVSPAPRVTCPSFSISSTLRATLHDTTRPSLPVQPLIGNRVTSPRPSQQRRAQNCIPGTTPSRFHALSKDWKML